MPDRAESTDPLQHVGLTRTDMHCHACSKDFIAIIDFDLEGEHEIECAFCGHIHYRKIEAGRVTESRYNTDNRSRAEHDTERRNVWKAKTERVATVTEAQHFMRSLWLRKGYN